MGDRHDTTPGAVAIAWTLRNPAVDGVRDGALSPVDDLDVIYEVRIRGHLGETLQTGFPDLIAQTRDGDTVLRGALRDQAALFGVLAQIEALGLELLQVQQLPPGDERHKSPDASDAGSPG